MSLNRKFQKKMGDAWKTATPGLLVQAHHLGRKVIDLSFGETYDFYDFASLTKIVCTTSSFMFRHDEKRFRINDPIHQFVSWYPETSPWRLSDLFRHSAGLTWWYPFYSAIEKKTDARTQPIEAWRIFEQILKRRVLNDLKKRPKSESPKRPPKSVYSDLDFFMLGLALESMSGKPIYDVWQEMRGRMNLRDTNFHPGNQSPLKKLHYAPTEDDQKWRKQVLQGQVHDQNTWALKGVAPHAGLFGTMDDLSKWGLHLRGAMRGGKSKHFASPETVQLFTKRSLPRARGDWALGFMMPSKVGASCGEKFSLDSVGHTGYTGTSIWFDPKRDLLVSILSNRIHPTVENIEIRTLRPKIHTWIAEEL